MINVEMETRQEKHGQFKWTREFNSQTPVDPELLGNKGANLAELFKLGLPIPFGFTLTTEAWRAFNQQKQLPNIVWKEILNQLKLLENQTGKKFGDPDNPLIVSVRSGSRYSMPGMMETLLNIGLTKESKPGLAKQFGESCADDSSQRLQQTFNQITGDEPPPDPYQQLDLAIEAVFSSWDNARAKVYRRYNGIPEEAGTAVTIQEMVFGNINDGQSGTGVFFTRDPRSGEKNPTGEFVSAGQGEDVVQEKRKTIEIPQELITQLEESGKKSEAHFQAPQDIEFTVEKGQLFLLQSRNLQGTPIAKIRIAIDFCQEGLITRHESYQRIRPGDVQAILKPQFEPKALEEARKRSLIGKGKPASIGAAVGKVVFTPEEVREFGKKGEAVVLVCSQLDPNDVETFFNLQALVTTLGGTASHMALVSQAVGKVAVASCKFERAPQKGEFISINGNGEVFSGRIPFAEKPKLSQDVEKFLEEWKKVWGESSWSSALYPTKEEYSRQTFLKRIEEITHFEEWPRKAQTEILLNDLIPPGEKIRSVVLKPDDIEGIRRASEEAFKQKYHEPIPRSCHDPEKLTGAPWAAIKKPEDIEGFLTNPDFPGKYGGFPHWIEDPSLTAIIVPTEPEGKMDPEQASDHYVFTISCLSSQPPRVIIDLIVGVAHLRTFEAIPPEKLIQIIAKINYDSPFYLGEIETFYGKDYQDDPYAQGIAQLVKETIFGRWWKPPFSLPHVMSVLDETYGLSVLEGQGRGKERPWGPLVYGAKGREEKEKVEEVTWQR